MQILEKKERLEALIGHYSGGKPSLFAKQIGVAPSTISTWISRNSLDYDLIFAKCENLSPGWLLTGQGSMLKSENPIQSYKTLSNPNPPQESIKRPNSLTREEEIDALRLLGLDIKGIELIPFVSTKVAAGFGSEDFAIAKEDIKDYYVIPKWRRQHVDFIIEVTGDSMVPKYYPGVEVGCSILKSSRFIQWNKVHVVATREQGLLIKRLMPSEHEDCLLAVSENSRYLPFDIPKDEITGIALVIGSVSLE